jgi:multidrug efflux pump subunit AcrA (membrane-fusion protein)
VPLPPELGNPVYEWLRRLALQTDLAGADHLLRDALAELTSSLSVMLIYAGPEGLHTLSGEDELPKEEQPIQAVARARRALVTSHYALVPIASGIETLAVIALTRNARQPAYTLIEQVFMAAVARESAGIMHHLVVQHLQRKNESEADKKSLYRPEALESHRHRGQEGVVAELSPSWVRRTYYVIVVMLLGIFGYAAYKKVPHYAEGTGVVIFDAKAVNAPAPGTVDTVYVQSGQQVHKGELLVKLVSQKEDADLDQTQRDLESAEQAYLFDPSDEQVRKSIKTAQSAFHHAEDMLEARNIRAPKDGVVSEIRIRPGAGLSLSDPILQIVEPGAEPEVWAFLPGTDRPRFHVGQELQVSLTGFKMTNVKPKIYAVGRDVIGYTEVKRTLGPEIADGLHLAQDASYVIVKAKLPGRTFKSDHKEFRFHQGMAAKAEVLTDEKRFLARLFPSVEKYVE